MVKEIRDKAQLLEFLQRDKGLAAYFLGDLHEPHFERCTWYANLDAGERIDALALLYRHPFGPTLLTLGDAEGIEAVAQAYQAEWPDTMHAHIPIAHVPVYERHYRIEQGRALVRMVVRRDSYREPHDSRAVRVLSKADLPGIREVLEDYRDNFFDASDLDSGYYYGAYEGTELASMAGVHAVSLEHGISMLGNIVTRRSKRRMGYGRLCTACVVHELLEVMDTVALNVYEDNDGAIAMYEQLGFTRYARFLFARCTRLAETDGMHTKEGLSTCTGS